MLQTDALTIAFVTFAFVVQLALIAHFALRKWAFATAMRFGPLIYALCIPATIVSVALWVGGKPWYLWAAGFIYTAWAVYGYTVEYILHIDWRQPVRWGVLIPYVTLYLASMMFYWWPLATIEQTLWYVYVALFVISTVLNVISHKGPEEAAGVRSVSHTHGMA